MNEREINKPFKRRNWNLTEDALNLLTHYLQKANPRDATGTLSKIIGSIDRSSVKDSIVDSDIISKVLDTLTLSTNGSLSFFSVLDVFKVPSFDFNLSTRKLEPKPPVQTLYGSAADKIKVYVRRYRVVHDKLVRYAKDVAFSTVDTLGNSKSEHNVLGFLSQIKEGEIYLEDLTGNIPLDLSRLSSEEQTGGLFTEISLVLVHGSVVNGKLLVDRLGLPPSESKAITEKAYPGVDFFGSAPGRNLLPQIKIWEQENQDNFNIYVLSDLWLDKPKVMVQLKALFYGCRSYSAYPSVIILMGNFTSRPFGQEPGDLTRLKQYFEALGQLISDFPEMVNKSKFIFVPGPHDSGIQILPRPPLPSFLTACITEKVMPVFKSKSNSNETPLIFATNPCRIRCGTKQIVVFRDDIANKMRRNCILEPTEALLEDHLVATLASNSHLCPLAERKKPIYWNHDQALSLFPLPDALILGDQYNSYHVTHEDMVCFNPGSFSVDFHFYNYEPFKKGTPLESSRVPDMDT